MDKPIAAIRNRLKIAISQRGISQQELSDITKIPKSSISQYISGYAKPKQDRIDLLSKALDVNPAWILGYDVPMTLSEKEPSNVTPIPVADTVQIPVYGKVPAGLPTEAIEYIENTIDIPASWVTCGQEYIGLTVSGDSMFPKYIDGDIVVIRLQPDCESGQDCVVYVNGFDSTLKRVVKERDGIILQPLNPEYSPKMYGYNDEFNPVTILGVVVELRRKI